MRSRGRMLLQRAGQSSTRKRWSERHFVCQCKCPSMGSGGPVPLCKCRMCCSGMTLAVESSCKLCRQRAGRSPLSVPDSWPGGTCCWKRSAQLCLFWNRARIPAHTLLSNLHSGREKSLEWLESSQAPCRRIWIGFWEYSACLLRGEYQLQCPAHSQTAEGFCKQKD